MKWRLVQSTSLHLRQEKENLKKEKWVLSYLVFIDMYLIL